MIENKENHIIATAHPTFLRYGFKRTTMGDIAEAAGMSRPALYLVFANKEDVFKAVIRRMNTRHLAEIEQGLRSHSSLSAKLNFAFDVWTIQPFEMILRSADAKELIYSAYELASDVLDESGAAFEAILTKIIDSYRQKSSSNMTTKKLAHMLRGASRGFKELAKDSNELRQLINDFIELVIPVI